MKVRRMSRGRFITFTLVCVLLCGMRAGAKENETVKKGIFAGDIELSGMTAAEASAAVRSHVDGLKEKEITFLIAEDAEVTVKAEELGIAWENEEIIDEALKVGSTGNVIERYKILKDLENESLIYPVELSFDRKAVSDIIREQCTEYDVEATDASLIREEGEFKVVEGREGHALNVEASVDTVMEFLSGWDGEDASVGLDVEVTEPRGSEEELAQVKDLLGSFSTTYSTSDGSRGKNVETGCRLIDGTLLYPGDEFSASDAMAPYTYENGYAPAASYMNGRVVDSMGGGVCQVSTTLYDALLLAELEITERFNHSMIVGYVQPSMDAAIADTSGKDLKFVNDTEYPIYIEGITENRQITFNIYGKETRPANREVRYESVVLEVINPPGDAITPDEGQPIGYVVSDSAHVGYRAQLWKVVTEDGREVSRTQVNSSSYKMVPRSAVVGVATEDPQAKEEIMAAIGTNNLDHVRNVIAILTGQGNPNPEPQE